MKGQEMDMATCCQEKKNYSKEIEIGIFQVERGVKRRLITKVKRMHGRPIGKLQIHRSRGKSMQFETKGSAEIESH